VKIEEAENYCNIHFPKVQVKVAINKISFILTQHWTILIRAVAKHQGVSRINFALWTIFVFSKSSFINRCGSDIDQAIDLKNRSFDSREFCQKVWSLFSFHGWKLRLPQLPIRNTFSTGKALPEGVFGSYIEEVLSRNHGTLLEILIIKRSYPLFQSLDHPISGYPNRCNCTVNGIGLVYLPMVIKEHSRVSTVAQSSTEFK
jgi:hypothetical protein